MSHDGEPVPGSEGALPQDQNFFELSLDASQKAELSGFLGTTEAELRDVSESMLRGPVHDAFVSADTIDRNLDAYIDTGLYSHGRVGSLGIEIGTSLDVLKLALESEGGIILSVDPNLEEYVELPDVDPETVLSDGKKLLKYVVDEEEKEFLEEGMPTEANLERLSAFVQAIRATQERFDTLNTPSVTEALDLISKYEKFLKVLFASNPPLLMDTM